MTPDPNIDLFLPGREPLAHESASEKTQRRSWKHLVENKPQMIPLVHSSSAHLDKIIFVLYAWHPLCFREAVVSMTNGHVEVVASDSMILFKNL